MTIQNITSMASASMLSLSDNGQININVSGWYGYGFDINITSTAASGTLSIFTQYTDPVDDTFIGSPVISYAISGGTFPSGQTRLTVDSNFLITKGFVILQWVGGGDGNIAIVGYGLMY